MHRKTTTAGASRTTSTEGILPMKTTVDQKPLCGFSSGVSLTAPLVTVNSRAALSVNPRLFVQRGSYAKIAPMIDWAAVKSQLITSDGELLDDLAARFSEASERCARSKVLVASQGGNYLLRVGNGRVRLSFRRDVIYCNVNPTTCLQVFNEFCTYEPAHVLANYLRMLIAQIRKVLRIPDLSLYDAQLTRLDLTQMLDMGSAHEAAFIHAYLRMQMRASSEQGILRDDAVYGNAITISPNSSYSSLKTYRVSGKRAPLVPPDKDRWIRMELVLRDKGLKRLVSKGQWHPHDLAGIFRAALSDLRVAYRQYRPSRQNLPPRFLPSKLWMVWVLWASGCDLRVFPQLSKRLLSQYRREMMEFGIDIMQPPTPRSLAASSRAISIEEMVKPARWDVRCHSDPGLLEQLQAMVAAA